MEAGRRRSATLEGGEEAAARFWRAVRRRERGSGGRGVGGGSATGERGGAAARLRRAGRRRQRCYEGRGIGCSAVLEGGEEALVTELSAEETHLTFEKTQLSVVSARSAKTT